MTNYEKLCETFGGTPKGFDFWGDWWEEPYKEPKKKTNRDKFYEVFRTGPTHTGTVFGDLISGLKLEWWGAEYEESEDQRKTGVWLPEDDGFGGYIWKCSACGCEWTFIDGAPKDNNAWFCPECGADLRKTEYVEDNSED